MLWGKNFHWEGIKGRIDALMWMQDPTVASNAGRLYFNLDGENLKQYDINFYSSNIPSENRVDDPVIASLCGTFLKDQKVVDIGWGADRMLYVVLSDGGLRCCGRLNNNNNQQQATTNSYDFYHFDESEDGKIRAIITPPRQQHIMILLKTDGRWLQFDLVNWIASTPAFYGDALAWRVGGDEALIVYRQATSEIRTLLGVTFCPLDQMFPLPSKPAPSFLLLPCVSMQCIRKKSPWWCGPNSTRNAGSAACLCEPGFFLSSEHASLLCAPCPPTNYYCTGGQAAPTLCPENSVILDQPHASSSCICLAGYYRYADSICLPCPSNHWCPLFSSSLSTVVACHGGGETNGGGMTSPLDCVCPPRTFGVKCLPCDTDADCSLPVSQQPLLVATVISASTPPLFSFYISASGASNQKTMIMDQCVTWAVHVVYEVASQIWVVISPASFLWQNATKCLSLHGFNLISVYPLGPPRIAVGVKQLVRCAGIAQEWMKTGCGCIAGYEPLSTPSWGIQCFPCLNGTVRAQYSPGGCEPCKSVNEVAPSMGMAACVCAGDCGVSQTDTTTHSISTMMQSSVVIIIIVAGVALLTFTLVSAYCFLI